MAAPSRVVRVKRVGPDRAYRRHVLRKKVIALIAGLALLPVSILMIAAFDGGPLGRSLVGWLGGSYLSTPLAQITPTIAPIATGTPTASQPETPTSTLPPPTLFQPPRQTPRPTLTATLAQPTAGTLPAPTLFQPPRQTPRPTLAATAAQAPGSTVVTTPGPSTSANVPAATTVPTQAVGAAAPTTPPTQTPGLLAPTTPPPQTLPVTGFQAATIPGQAIGLLLLAVSLILMGAGLWPDGGDG